MSGDDKYMEKDWHGRPIIRAYHTELSGAITEATQCNECDGTGDKYGRITPRHRVKCDDCRGIGYTEKQAFDAETARAIQIQMKLSKSFL